MNEKAAAIMLKIASPAFFFLSLFGVFGTTTANAETVTLYTEEFPPYNYLDENNQIRGLSVDLARQVMTEAGLDFEVRLMPWSRTYREALRDKSGLIFSLTRTQSREEKFDWLFKVARSEFYLFSRKDERREVSLATIRRGDFTAVCVNSDISCTLLSEVGFPEHKLVKRWNTNRKINVFMVGNKRVDLYFGELKVYQFYTKDILNKDKVALPVLKISPGTDLYLAAGLHVDKTLRNKVKAAHLRLVERGGLKDE